MKKEEAELIKNPINVFQCDCAECKELDSMVFEEFKHHLFKAHNLKADQLKGKKQMIMHMDGSFWYSSTYKWTLENGMEFSQFIKQARAKDDLMRCED